MNFSFTKEQEELRLEIRNFLQEELEKGSFSTHTASLTGTENIEFSQKMAERGWIGITWPEKYGGQGRTYVDKMIMLEECFKVQAPIGHHFLADRQVGPAIMAFGSDWQKEFFLPRIVRAEEDSSFCLLFSEPNAGSDLAAVATKAVKDGDHYVINGQKVWTSSGHKAAYGWLLAKTDLTDTQARHRTLSEFILDMKTPGVTVKPIINMAGEHSFNEIFLDDVKIHRKYLVGRENEGFKQIMAQMDYERAGIERLMQNYPVYKSLVEHVKALKKEERDPEFYAWAKDRLAQLEIEYNAGRLLCYYTAWLVDQGEKPSSQAALSKAFCTEYEQRLADLSLTILGPAGQIRPGVEWAALGGDPADSYLWAPSYTLQGGSVEVLKNIVAQRGLNLPRG